MTIEEYDKMIENGSGKFAYISAGKKRIVTKDYLNVKVSRMIKKANIEAVERGEFPIRP